MSAHVMIAGYLRIGSFLMGMADEDVDDFGRSLFIFALWPLVPIVLAGAAARILWREWRVKR